MIVDNNRQIEITLKLKTDKEVRTDNIVSNNGTITLQKTLTENDFFISNNEEIEYMFQEISPYINPADTLKDIYKNISFKKDSLYLLHEKSHELTSLDSEINPTRSFNLVGEFSHNYLEHVNGELTLNIEYSNILKDTLKLFIILTNKLNISIEEVEKRILNDNETIDTLPDYVIYERLSILTNSL
jgi:hypothetical protein